MNHAGVAMMDNRQLAYVEHQVKYEPPLEVMEPRFSVNLWKNEPLDWVELICLLPNGFILILRVNPATTIQTVKAELVAQAKKMPLSYVIKEACEYQVYGISTFNIEPYTDETKRLSEVQPYFGLLSLGDRADTTAISSDYELTKMVNGMIGKSFDHHRTQGTPEIDDFRLYMTQICDNIEMERSIYTWQQRLLYEHPLRLANSAKMPELIRERHPTRTFLIVVKNENDQSTFTLSVNEQDTPFSLTESTLQKMNRSQMKMNDRTADYILKVSGRDEYLLGDYPLIQFLYIQETLSDSAVPNVVLQSVYRLESYINHHNEQAIFPKRPPPKKQPALLPKTPSSLWDMGNYFQLTLHSISNVNYDKARAFKVGVHVGLFHGEHKLCAQRSTDSPNGNFDTFLFNDLVMDFDIQMRNLPRMTRLCIVIFEVTKMSRSKKSSNNKDSTLKDVSYNKNPLAWVNTTLFDYKDILRTGRQTLYTWTYADDIQSDEVFHPLGTIEPNPRKEECALVELTFHSSGTGSVRYPSEEVVLQYARDRIRRDNQLQQQQAEAEKPLKELKDLLANYTGLDKIYEMVDQDRNAIWERRNDIMRELPEELSILLHCVYWKERDDVADIWYLLKQWPLISIERSLELLDYAYPDPAVRRFAIRCLHFLKDEDLLLYLLQLVQAIKHESYLDSDLVVFLLERALRNQRIGHYFFWHLRSEMQTPSMQTRFGLLLEVYLKGCKHHVAPLRKQLHVLEKLKQGSLIAKKGSKEKVKTMLQDFLRDQRNSGVFQNIQNPLNPSFRCSGVTPDRCKVMDSKMRPLWVVFENADMNSNDVHIIFKNGDDLRQDMLTLQMLRVMDQLWKRDGMDFRMNIYNCISMEQRLGMIEVVRHAETIANIQKEKGMFSATSPFKKGSLYSWLKEHNKTADKLNKAINEFTLSCAGYCVATYVLGVADRHSDNIMVKRNGQLFHIDFGHILGHFKEKFGVRRERVPFVLTHDFVYVINKGCNDREAKEFCHFQELCERAFLVLRKHGCLILSLFSMMISTGLPELSSEKDLNYLRETLVLDYTEEKAREHFRAKFSEALANSWKTSLNWASHNFSKNNKQ
ncbi:phosphatidylinositol 4,5-bisphosphate 3-kinase catalytic subunit delta isoform [Drosophila elegans]|uniref:phosphatidylinositol 4,5-bisphosphate 3-kinase catalytic subunit delta isoform n=1 Tax=Drosophila elegans TaxID=30023 RepID=UPI0007E6135D|nr:phosphatidylinositol 4,5-bisphosphate 3-kinase catalytic subunit delta isoform [Drosophila elegans]XP_017118938.1 phosphatidylinositol 4,5-bisphosphate 3-kinase catalytic subunit delta isoform [Drosophila elegans]